MVYGIGTWLKKPDLFLRFFNENEQFSGDFCQNEGAACRHYAARFAAKEAFSKAMGTGFTGLSLNDFYVAKDKARKPFYEFGEKTKKNLEAKIGKDLNIQLSISHEKEYAVAFVIIEKLS